MADTVSTSASVWQFTIVNVAFILAQSATLFGDIYLTVLYLVVALWMHVYMHWYVFWLACIFLIFMIAYWLLNQLNLVTGHRLFTASIVVLCMEKLCVQEWIKGQ
jgi:hypothetical protein